MSSAISTNQTRLEQLDQLHTFTLDGSTLLIHGSLARAALMGDYLPDLEKPSGKLRDIDVFTPVGLGKIAVEEQLDNVSLAVPAPIDAGLCEILVREGDSAFVKKGAFSRPLRDFGIFDEVQDYELTGTDGIKVRSFSPTGMLAAHYLQQPLLRPDHYGKDRRFIAWLKENNTELPKELERSIAEFHAAYNEAYPHGKLLTSVSEVYRVIVPEFVRKRLRQRTHQFMYNHAGRKTPFINNPS